MEEGEKDLLEEWRKEKSEEHFVDDIYQRIQTLANKTCDEDENLNRLYSHLLQRVSVQNPVNFHERVVDQSRVNVQQRGFLVERKTPLNCRFLNQVFRKKAQQAEMISKEYSLWNACAAINRNDGSKNWDRTIFLVRMLVQYNIECPCIVGDEFGVFGETPLHILLLFNAKTNRVCHAFFELWELCHDVVRLKTYDVEPYIGENLLHIAIVRGYGADFVKELLGKSCACRLLEDRATGKFFKSPKMFGGYCTMLGESPLGFAACSGNVEVFGHLWQEFKKRNGAADFRTSEEGHGLLHLAIMASVPKDLKNGNFATEAVKIFDQVWTVVREDKDPHELLTMGRNKDGHTPLSLAAAKGSVDIFRCIFDSKLLVTRWTYGGVHRKRMYLEGVDVALPSPAEDVSGHVVDSAEDHCPSLLEILVAHGRKDILHHSRIGELVEAKWDTYGREIFHRELLVSCFFTLAVYLLPMIKFDEGWFWRAWHTLVYALTAFVSHDMCYSRLEPTALQCFVFGGSDAFKVLSSRLCFFLRRLLVWARRVGLAATKGLLKAAAGAAMLLAAIALSGAAVAIRAWMASRSGLGRLVKGLSLRAAGAGVIWLVHLPRNYSRFGLSAPFSLTP